MGLTLEVKSEHRDMPARFVASLIRGSMRLFYVQELKHLKVATQISDGLKELIVFCHGRNQSMSNQARHFHGRKTHLVWSSISL